VLQSLFAAAVVAVIVVDTFDVAEMSKKEFQSITIQKVFHFALPVEHSALCCYQQPQLFVVVVVEMASQKKHNAAVVRPSSLHVAAAAAVALAFH
jgi:hypothetical protein